MKHYKKVIMLTGFYAPSIGGMEKRLEKWASVLLKNGIGIEVFTTALFSNIDHEVLGGVSVIREGHDFTEWIAGAQRYVRKNCDTDTAILVAALGPGMDAGLLKCLEYAHERGSHVVMSVPTADHLDRAIARNEGGKEFLEQVDRLITVSDDVEEFSLYSREVIYLPNFIMDHDLLKLSDPYPSENHIAFFGRIARRKRPEILVEVASLLPSDFKLVVQGPAGYGEETLYKDIMSALKVQHAQVIKPNKIPSPQVMEAKYFINPSEVEGCSNALLEAMNRGSIPLVSDIKENRRVLGDLVPLCSNGAESYVKVFLAIEKSGESRKIQESMRKHIVDNYSERKNSTKLIEALTVFG